MTTKNEESWLDGVGDVLGNIADLAASGRMGRWGALAGGIAQPLLDTPAYQLRQQQLANASYDAEHHKEWTEEKHKQARDAHEMRLASDYRASMANERAQESHDFSMEENRKNAPLNRRMNELRVAGAELRQQQAEKNVPLQDALREQQMANLRAERQHKEEAQVADNILAGLQDSGLTPQEIKSLSSTPVFRRNVQVLSLGRQLLRAREDDEAWDDAQRQIEALGGKVIEQQGQDGTPSYLVQYAQDKPPIPLTEDTYMQLTQMMQDELQQEIGARQFVGVNSIRGNAEAKIIANETNRLIPYLGGSAVKSLDTVKQMLERMPPQYRNIMIMRRVLEDYFNPAVPSPDKDAEIEQVLAKDQKSLDMLERMGYTYDAGEDDIADAKIIDAQSRIYSLPQFLEKLRTEDEGGRMFAKQVDALKEVQKLKAGAQFVKGLKRQLDRQGEATEPEVPQRVQEARGHIKEIDEAVPGARKVLSSAIDAHNNQHEDDAIGPDEMNVMLSMAWQMALKQAGGKAEGVKEFNKYFMDALRHVADEAGVELPRNIELGTEGKAMDEDIEKTGKAYDQAYSEHVDRRSRHDYFMRNGGKEIARLEKRMDFLRQKLEPYYSFQHGEDGRSYMVKDQRKVNALDAKDAEQLEFYAEEYRKAAKAHGAEDRRIGYTQRKRKMKESEDKVNSAKAIRDAARKRRSDYDRQKQTEARMSKEYADNVESLKRKLKEKK